MNLFKDVANIGKAAFKSASKHAPEILAGIGIAGFVSTTVIAVKAKPKADILVENKKRELNIDKLTIKDTAKVIWRPYLPAIITGVASATCVIGSVSTSVKRNAVLSAAYTLATDAAKEYREKVVETIGEEKEREIRDKVAEKKIKDNPVSNNNIIVTGYGDSLCYDSISGRYFRSNIEKIKKVINELNNEMLQNNYVSLDEYYSRINLESIDLGNELGWTSESGILIEGEFTSKLADNGDPCLVISFNIMPRAKFDSIFA